MSSLERVRGGELELIDFDLSGSSVVTKVKNGVGRTYEKSETLVNRGADLLSLIRQIGNFTKSLFPGIVSTAPVLFTVVAAFKLTNVLQLPFIAVSIVGSVVGLGKSLLPRNGESRDILEIGNQFFGLFGNIGDFAVTGAAGAEAIVDILIVANVQGAAEFSGSLGSVTIWVTGIGAIFMLALIAAEGFATLQDVRNLYRASKAQKAEIEKNHFFDTEGYSIGEAEGKIFNEYLGKDAEAFKGNLSKEELDRAYSLLKQKIALKIVSHLAVMTAITVFFVAIVVLVLGTGNANSAGYALLSTYYAISNAKNIGAFITEICYRRKLTPLLSTG
jgi:hypothetical protein